jgi:hypothetical protein
MGFVRFVDRDYDGRVDDVVLTDSQMQRSPVDLAEKYVPDAIVVLVHLDDRVVCEHGLDLASADAAPDHLVSERWVVQTPFTWPEAVADVELWH